MNNKCEPKDYYETPPNLFNELDKEFGFELDACATAENTKVPGCFFDEQQNALEQRWSKSAKIIFCNPPYSKAGKKDEFIAKAVEAMNDGCTVVMVIPAKTNTKAFHKYLWDKTTHSPRKGIQLRFPEGRPVFYLNGKKAANSGRNEIMIVVFKNG